jgi:hypothetical protein
MLGIDAGFTSPEFGLGDFVFECAELHAAKIIDLGGCGLRLEVRFTSLKSLVPCRLAFEVCAPCLQCKKNM